MERVNLPNLPASRAADYRLDDFNPPRFARVIYTPQESKPDRKMIEVQAFEVDAAGVFVPAPNGMPSRTSGSVHVISVSGIGDTHTLQPGWVRVVGDYNIDTMPENAVAALALPISGSVGDLVYVEPTLYRWSEGMLEDIMKGKASELAGLLRNSLALGDFEL